jgi:hypothetical protein
VVSACSAPPSLDASLALPPVALLLSARPSVEGGAASRARCCSEASLFQNAVRMVWAVTYL